MTLSFTAQCSSRPNDVVFVYDAEWLSRKQNSFIVTTISDVIESEVINTKELRFGVIREASRVQQHDIQLTDNWKQPSFKTKLDQTSKKSLIYKLLYKARTKYFNNHRPDLKSQSKTIEGSQNRKRTVVLFLDSDMTEWFQASKQAYWLDQADVQIIVVGLGKHFNKLQALNLTTFRNLIITSSRDKDKKPADVSDGIIKRLCR